ncbi:MAG: hypothetical protein ACQKBU_12710 [Verrucomicrobiales bacterium]
MKKLGITLGLIAALTALLATWLSPERILKRRVQGLLTAAEVPASMNEIARSASGNRIEKFLAEQIRVSGSGEFSEPVDTDPFSRESVTSRYAAAARFSKEITFRDLEFTGLEIADERAKVQFNVDALVEFQSRRPIDGILSIDSVWVKASKSWQLESIHWNERPRG